MPQMPNNGPETDSAKNQHFEFVKWAMAQAANEPDNIRVDLQNCIAEICGDQKFREEFLQATHELRVADNRCRVLARKFSQTH